MASSTANVYCFVNDTAFYNRDFDTSSTTTGIDQGACCTIDKVLQMFAEPTYVRDTRTKRCAITEITKAGPNWSTSSEKAGGFTLKQLMTNEKTYMNGRMSLVYDGSKLTDEVKYTFNDETQRNALFSFLEILGHYHQFDSDLDRAGLGLAVAEAQAASYKVAAGNAKVVSLDGSSDFIELDSTYHSYTGDSTTKVDFTTNRRVRKAVVIEYTGKNALGGDVLINLYVWWGRDAFISDYPLTTITDVIFPCKPDCLYELLDNYKSVSAASSAISEYSSKKMNEIVAKADHTGVYTFTTDYYAYPDTQPSNTFKLSFSCVYKGHAPTLEEVKDRLRTEVLAILPAHSEEEWRKKLPGLIANRQFFLLPMYGNIWPTGAWKEESATKHRWGIFDLTIIAEIIRKTLGSTYLDQQSYCQIVSPKYSQYPVLAIPHAENPSSGKLISSLYPDYIGIKISDGTDPEAPATAQSANTQDFNTHFDDTLSKAAGNTDVSELTEFPGIYWAHFTPIDGTTYYILAKKSYPTTL